MAGQDLIPVKKIITNVIDGNNVTTHGLPKDTPISEILSGAAATTTEAGSMLQAAFVADGAVPYADLTAAANHVNSILASLQAAGIMASS